MSLPAREPLQFVPPPDPPADQREERPMVVVWGAYPAMRAGIRALLAEMEIDSADEMPAGARAVIVADAGDEPIAMLLTELREQLGDEAPVIVLAPDASAYAQVRPGPEMPAGLLLRDVTAAELAAAVQAVASGLTVLDPAVAPVLAREGQQAQPELEPLDEALTERELDVLRELALGLPNKAIALRLGISEHTVKYHVGEILGKLGAASRTEAVMVGARRGLLPL